jgi:hypothetical protein
MIHGYGRRPPVWFDLNRFDPLADGLAGYFTPNFDVGDRSIIDLSYQALATQATAANRPSPVFDPEFGRVFDYVSSDWFDAPDSPHLNVGTGDFSVSVWLKANSSETGQDRGVVSKGRGGGGGKRYMVRVEDAADVIQVEVDDDSTKTDIFGSTSIRDDQWHFVVFTADRDGNGIIYVDGEVDGTADISASSGSLDDNTLSFRIGRETSLDSYHVGLIGDVGLWKRVLRADEVKRLFNPSTRWSLRRPLFADFVPTATSSGTDFVRIAKETVAVAESLSRFRSLISTTTLFLW